MCIPVSALLAWLAIFASLASAAFWFRAALVKVSRDALVRKRLFDAHKAGETPNLAGAALDGSDLSGTFQAQSFWNALGASFAAVAIVLQAFAGLLN